MLDSSYDYVVIGGGTAGSVLATRLSERDATVLLLEAGPVIAPEEVYSLESFPTRLLGSSLDWSYATVAQSGTDGTVHAYPRGRLLGGTSAINAMAHIRGHRANYDGWAAHGALGWDYGALLPLFKRSETATGRDPNHRGTDGPLSVGPPTEISTDALAFRDAVIQAGHRFSTDINADEQAGAFLFDMNFVQGRRQSAADAYLRPVMHRNNLTVVGNANAHHVDVRKGRCATVEFAMKKTALSVAVREEAIITAGAIGSPQLLMLSGIGPAEHLRRHGIGVTADLPGVGQNLQDHIQCRVVYQSTRQIASAPNGFCPMGALLRSSIAPTDAPDVFLLLLDFPTGPAVDAFELALPDTGYTIAFSQQCPPASRGTVSLAGKDPDLAPIIDPRYYSDESDLSAMVEYLAMAREVGNTPALQPWGGIEVLPGPSVTTASAVRRYIRAASGTSFHPVGTCQMGTDGSAVVDPQLKVHGIEGLRVADASVMPDIVNVNPNATVVAIAEKAIDLIFS